MPRWSDYYPQPDGSSNISFTGGSNFDVESVTSTDPTTGFDTGAYNDQPWSTAPLRAYNPGSGTLWTQVFVHLNLYAVVANLAGDVPDFPYPFPPSVVIGWEPETNHTATFADLADRFTRFRFAFDVNDDTSSFGGGGYIPDDVDIYVRPWTPAELSYHNHVGLPSGSAPGAKCASRAD